MPLTTRDREPLELVALASIRRRRLWVWAWFATAMPLIIGVSVAQPRLLARAVATWAGVWVLLIWISATSRCPLCGKAFNNSAWRSNPWAPESMNCGLWLGNSP